MRGPLPTAKGHWNAALKPLPLWGRLREGARRRRAGAHSAPLPHPHGTTTP